MRVLTYLEYLSIRIRLRSSIFYTPTVEEQGKIIKYLKHINDSRSEALLKLLKKDENIYIRSLAAEAQNTIIEK